MAASKTPSIAVRYPDYRVILARSVARVDERMRTAVRVDDPFPHVWVEDLLPEDFFQLLADAWPPDDVFWSEQPELRLDLVPAPAGTSPSDKRVDHYGTLPASVREVWDFFVLAVNRRIVGAHLQRLFAPEIGDRLTRLEAAHAAGTPLADYLRPPYSPQMNVGRMMVRGYGYRLRPHVDALAYLATALYYFPQEGDDPAALGTTLYRAERELDVSVLLERRKTVYFGDAGIAVHPVRQMPFTGRALLAFANTGRSAHGMQIARRGVWRRAYQSHLSLKGDDDHL